MRIRDLLAPESIQLNGSATGKEDVLNQMVSLMVKSGKIADEEEVIVGQNGEKGIHYVFA